MSSGGSVQSREPEKSFNRATPHFNLPFFLNVNARVFISVGFVPPRIPQAQRNSLELIQTLSCYHIRNENAEQTARAESR